MDFRSTFSVGFWLVHVAYAAMRSLSACGFDVCSWWGYHLFSPCWIQPTSHLKWSSLQSLTTILPLLQMHPVLLITDPGGSWTPGCRWGLFRKSVAQTETGWTVRYPFNLWLTDKDCSTFPLGNVLPDIEERSYALRGVKIFSSYKLSTFCFMCFTHWKQISNIKIIKFSRNVIILLAYIVSESIDMSVWKPHHAVMRTWMKSKHLTYHPGIVSPHPNCPLCSIVRQHQAEQRHSVSYLSADTVECGQEQCIIMSLEFAPYLN